MLNAVYRFNLKYGKGISASLIRSSFDESLCRILAVNGIGAPISDAISVKLIFVSYSDLLAMYIAALIAYSQPFENIEDIFQKDNNKNIINDK
mgnify:CR=1 FL=1